jgi:hypothetical protein
LCPQRWSAASLARPKGAATTRTALPSRDHAPTALQQDSIFEWSTFSLPIVSIVHEFVPNSRLAWFGKSKGLDALFYHTWYLVKTSDGCEMITEEVVQGPGAVAFFGTKTQALFTKGTKFG